MHGEDEAERDDEPELPAAAAPQRGPPQRHEHERREERPQEHRAACADLVEKAALRQRGAELHRGDRPSRTRNRGRHPGIMPTWPSLQKPATLPARKRSYEELEQIFSDIDAPFALVDLDALWSNSRRDARARRGHADPRGEQVGALPGTARARSSSATRLPRPDDIHPAGDAVAARAGLRRPPARVPDRRPRCIGRTGPPRHRAPADRDGRLGRAPRPDRGGDRRGRARRARVHRRRHELVAVRRAAQDRRQALARPNARGGTGARGADRPPPEPRARGAHGLRGAHRRGRRPAPR